MDNRLIDIIVYLARHFQNHSFSSFDEKDFDLDSIFISLHDEGYSQSEIDSAVSWYFENEMKWPHWPQEQLNLQPSQAIRILHPFERIVISADAYGFLTQIHQLGLISSYQLEAIIENALSSGWEVDLPLVKTIASVVLFETRDDMDLGENFISYR